MTEAGSQCRQWNGRYRPLSRRRTIHSDQASTPSRPKGSQTCQRPSSEPGGATAARARTTAQAWHVDAPTTVKIRAPHLDRTLTARRRWLTGAVIGSAAFSVGFSSRRSKVMASRYRMAFTAAIAACGLLAAGVGAAPAGAVRAHAHAAQAPAKSYSPNGSYTAVWSRAQALKVRLDPTNTKPLIGTADFPRMSDQMWIWDTWPLVNLGTKPVSYKGWNVIFSLVAPKTLGFNDRHEFATIGYFYSRDAKSWKYGGTIFPAGTPLGTRQWAGSAALIGDEVNLFYTASGTREGFTGHDP